MSTESANPNPVIDGDPNLTPNVPDDDADLTALEANAKVDDKGNKLITVPLGTIAHLRKQSRELNKRVKELEPVAARVSEVDAKLTEAMPIIQAVRSEPRLLAEAMRKVGAAPTSARVEQPNEQDDPDAAEVAETLNLYLADGVTPDLVKARKLMGVIDRRGDRNTREVMRPIAGAVVGSRAERNIQTALSATNDHGTPLATPESIKEAVEMMGGAQSPLLADERVLDLLLTTAAGLDSRKGRNPKPIEEPMWMARQGNPRVRLDVGISPEEKRIADRLGLSEADLTAAGKKLATGRSVVLGE